MCKASHKKYPTLNLAAGGALTRFSSSLVPLARRLISAAGESQLYDVRTGEDNFER
jgi:hypothetical protein